MLITIDTNDADPNTIGELLRDQSFVGEGYGCYSTFDVADGYCRCEKGSMVFRQALDKIGGTVADYKQAWGDDWQSCRKYDADMLNVFHNGNTGVTMAWLWDGDGTLLFMFEGKSLINTDCKKNYRWEWANG